MRAAGLPRRVRWLLAALSVLVIIAHQPHHHHLTPALLHSSGRQQRKLSKLTQTLLGHNNPQFCYSPDNPQIPRIPARPGQGIKHVDPAHLRWWWYIAQDWGRERERVTGVQIIWIPFTLYLGYTGSWYRHNLGLLITDNCMSADDYIGSQLVRIFL